MAMWGTAGLFSVQNFDLFASLTGAEGSFVSLGSFLQNFESNPDTAQVFNFNTTTAQFIRMDIKDRDRRVRYAVKKYEPSQINSTITFISDIIIAPSTEPRIRFFSTPSFINGVCWQCVAAIPRDRYPST
jgi:hypothetical protein